MNEEKKYSVEEVQEALRLTAMGTAGILGREDAEKTLEKLPKELAAYVMASTLAAHKAKSLAEKFLKELGGNENSKETQSEMTKEDAIAIARKHNKVPEVAAFMILGEMSPKEALTKAGIKL